MGQRVLSSRLPGLARCSPEWPLVWLGKFERAAAAFIVGAGHTATPAAAVGQHPWVAVAATATAAAGRGRRHHPSLSRLPGERRHYRHP